MTSSISIDWDKVNHPELAFQRFPSRRSVVYGTKGVVSCSQPLATEAGLEILRKGGNAADAAVATSAALNVTEPSCCGIGGDAFCLFYDAKTKEVKALNGSGKSPKKLNIEYLRQRGIEGGQIPLTDLNSVTVPGAAAAWADTVKTLGSGKLTLSEVLEPAIRLAEEGVPVSEIHGLSWKLSENLIKNASPNGDEMLLNGRAPRPGEVIKLPNLAQTFRELGKKGKDGFYKGRIAQAIVDLIKSKGGVMELDDLAEHSSAFVEPIKYTYANEVTVYEVNALRMVKAGITALLALGILEAMQEQGLIRPLLELEHNSPEYLHALIEALRLAFADSRWYVADPDVEHVPVKELLSKVQAIPFYMRSIHLILSLKEYLAKRARLFDPERTNPNLVHGNPVNSSDTVYFTVTSGAMHAVTFKVILRDSALEVSLECLVIEWTLAHKIPIAIPKGCGFTLQNRGNGFILDPKHPNALKGGKRPYHTIIPAMALRDNELFLSYGVMGGFMQPQGHVQVLLNILRGYTVQAALDAPRFCISAGMPDNQTSTTRAAGDANSEIYFEDAFQTETLEKLRVMGHDARVVEGFHRGMMGRGQVIQKLLDGSGKFVWAAGSDCRADGHAAAQI
ncbi:hypothetical protein D9756_004066 [Leucocoprinus leucothites]|uniref:Gamma-glutamyltranspeptidase n=1 Tax=Leucocoprinus leucothites TaxID=201217 RepID=A0A8H5D8Z0_9AGAR|nr:hypothetical protein D9756_004066 [Leucoagaricus leucothites]